MWDLVGRWAGRGAELLGKGAMITASHRREVALKKYKARLELCDEYDNKMNLFMNIKLDLDDFVNKANFVEGGITNSKPAMRIGWKNAVMVIICFCETYAYVLCLNLCLSVALAFRICRKFSYTPRSQ